MSERTYAPRSGGRIAEQRTSETRRRYRTEGSAALQPEVVPVAPGRERATEPGRARETAAAPRLRVAPPAPISAPRAPFIAVVIALVVAGVFGILLINTKTNENAFEISRLQDQQAALDNQQQDLENQIAGYESTGNLDAAARRLGLVKADTPAYIRLPDGKIIGVPKPGEGQPAVTAQDPATNAAAADGDAQNGVTATGTGQPTVQNGAAQNGAVQNGAAQNGAVQNGAVQNGAVQNGPVQNGPVQGGPAGTGTAAANGPAAGSGPAAGANPAGSGPSGPAGATAQSAG
jgi:hypothetical protein